MNPFEEFQKSLSKMQSLIEDSNDKNKININSNTINKRITDITNQSHIGPRKGDVIGVSRGIYDHVGVYIGNNRVIHFTSKSSDISTDNTIIETDMSRFMRDYKEFYSIDFVKMNKGMKKAEFVDELFEMIFGLDAKNIPGKEYKLYSPDETVQRAKSLIGYKGYDLTENNCEHFAMWCKTGIKESNQLLNKPYRIYHKYPFIINE